MGLIHIYKAHPFNAGAKLFHKKVTLFRRPGDFDLYLDISGMGHVSVIFTKHNIFELPRVSHYWYRF